MPPQGVIHFQGWTVKAHKEELIPAKVVARQVWETNELPVVVPQATDAIAQEILRVNVMNSC